MLTYTVEFDNKSGLADANDVVLTVPLPAGMSFVAGSFRLDGKPTGANPITGAAIGTVAGSTRTVIGTASGARREATFDLRVDAVPPAPAPARYDVTPTWTYTFVNCAGPAPQSGSFTSNTVTTEVAGITATKSASSPSIRPEEILTYNDHDLELRHGGERRHPRQGRDSNRYDLPAQYDNAQRSRGR